MSTKNNSSNSSNHLFAILACLGAASLWALLWYPLRLLEQMGLPGLWASLAIYVPAFFVVVPLLFRQKEPWPSCPWLMFALALAAGWTNLAFILAVLEGTVVRVLLLFYLSPVWTVILSRLFFYEPISKKSYFHLSLALFGAIVLLWNDQFDFHFAYADWLAISSGFAFALTNVLVRKIGDTPIIYKMLVSWVGVIVITLMGLILSSTIIQIPEFSSNALWLAAVVGIFGMIPMTFFAQYGVTHLPLHQSATLFLFEVPIGAISAALLSQEIMTGQEWLGGGLVMLAAWLTAKSTISHSPEG